MVIEHIPFAKLLLDNSTAFLSTAVEQFAKECPISLIFRADYTSSGIGIVERDHYRIKHIYVRGDISPELVAFWYNVTPRKDVDETSVPSYKPDILRSKMFSQA